LPAVAGPARRSLLNVAEEAGGPAFACVFFEVGAFLNLGANRAKRVTLWLLGAIKDELLGATTDGHLSIVTRLVL
jgi:hypothetical protein